MKELIVISGINLYTGGTLKVMRECIEMLSAFAADRFEIVALVHNTALFPAYDNVEYLAYPASRKSWLIRLYYEYWGFRKLSKELHPDIWISMHDTTPNVEAGKRIVYCHNPFPFYRPEVKNYHLQPAIVLLSLFSKYIYKTNIRKNDWVIVQQEWIRQSFKRMFGIDTLVVALPVKEHHEKETLSVNAPDRNTPTRQKTTFFFPAGAMIHKNFEVLCEATKLLGEKRKTTDYEVIITLSGSENRYARSLYRRYHGIRGLSFAGYLSREEMETVYRQCDCLVFPAKIETWGLPVTEAKEREIPLLVSDLPWAKETVGKYDRVSFFHPDDRQDLYTLMNDFIEKTISWHANTETAYQAPLAKDWNELLDLIINTKH